jgi:TolB-like protein
LPGPDIFLSYNREDAAIAKLFADAFAREGFDVWWDQTLRSGETYDDVTEAALRAAKAVAVLWSPRSVASHWVRAEATIAHRAKTLVPATIETCDKPVMFELTQTADLSHWRGEAGDAAWLAFLGDVRRMAGPKAAEGNSEAQPALGQVARVQRPMLAILPFACRSEHPEDEEFAEDLIEELILALTFSPWMEVVAASRAAVYRTGTRDLRQIGRELCAFYLLEGKMRRLGTTMRITVQLVAAEEGKVLWSQKYDRPCAKIEDAQEALVTDLAIRIGSQVERSEEEFALRKSENITPWEHFLRAVSHQGLGTRAGYEAAVAEAKRALNADPDFAYAYAVMLAAQAPLVIYRDDGEALAKEIIENIRRVRALKPDDPTVLAGCCSGLNALRRPREALPLAERAVAINPNIDYVRQGLGAILVNVGRVDEGLAELDAGNRISANIIRDHFHDVCRAAAYLQVDREDLALEAAERAVRKLVCPESLMECALCRALAGDQAGARDAIRQIRDSDPEMSRRHIDNLVRYFHFSASAVDRYVAIACGLWDQTEDPSKSL